MKAVDYSQGFVTLLKQLWLDVPAYEMEFRFCLEHAYRFDFAWLNSRPGIGNSVAVEIDGGNRMVRWSPKMKRNVAVGRHTGSADYVKLNLAVLYGWRVLRFTTEMLKKDPQGCVDVLRKALDRFGVKEA
jgi:very-short-patch-repair endonuclease